MSNCLNCKSLLGEKVRFCSNCGAKVVSRITLKNMVSEFAENVLGWDNKYFVTLKLMILKPQLVLGEYAQGVRKKYVHPFSYLLIGVTIVLFAFNLFFDDFLDGFHEYNVQQVNWMAENIGGSYADAEFQKEQLESSGKVQEVVFKYFNIIQLLVIPLYALFSFIVFYKRYNYAEHLIFNCYIQGTNFIATFLFFMLSLVVHPLVYLTSSITTVLFYSYALGKLHKLSFAESILKLLLFVGLFIIFSVLIGVALFAIGYLSAKFGYNIFEK